MAFEVLPKMENRLPVGPGSRGGRWHDAEFRRAYHRAWRAAHPEYRERERLRRWRARVPADSGVFPASKPEPLMHPAEFCACDCGCREHVVRVCGLCREGMHHDD